MAIFVIFHPHQIKSRLVVGEDDNSKFRIERVKLSTTGRRLSAAERKLSATGRKWSAAGR